MRLSLIIFFIIQTSFVNIQESSADKLYRIINDYRSQQKLKKIPKSISLQYVAQMHVADLQNNFKLNSKCNLHSWSNDKNKRWTSCCYTDDHSKANCMWNKPRELTKYNAPGYEISAYYSDSMTAEKALSQWKKSPGHHQVIINNEKWKNVTFKAMGVALSKNFACVWFGEETDTAKSIK